jgi:protein-ribulosamine 3-kinase
VIRGEDAQARVLAEFLSMKEIWQTMHSIAPKPWGYGKYEGQDAYFFICDLLDLDLNPGVVKHPDAELLGAKLATLHRNSCSPTGKFGFYCTVFDGKYPMEVSWNDNWTSFFRNLFICVYELDVKTNGFRQDLNDCVQIMLDKMLPRLLDPLTSGGQTIKPTLIHGDLWQENIGTESATGDIYIFDACAYYAHHELELGMWRCQHHTLWMPEFREAYLRHNPPSEPVEEFDDRNRLYSVKYLLIHAVAFPGSGTRDKALLEMRYLIRKFLPDEEKTLVERYGLAEAPVSVSVHWKQASQVNLGDSLQGILVVLALLLCIAAAVCGPRGLGA